MPNEAAAPELAVRELSYAEALREAMAGQDSQKVIEEVLQIVASREQASSF